MTRLRTHRTALALVVVAALLVAATAAAMRFAGGDEAPTRSATQAASPDPVRAAPEPERPALGRPDAPVTMVEYADYQCPFCGKFARDTKPQLIERYVRTGKLRFEWRDFPYMGPQSLDTAVAARAAGRQGRYWDFHDAVFALELRPFSGELSRARLLAISRRLGLDIDRFERDLGDPALADAVRADFQEGQSFGVTGTPTFVVNGRVVVGAQPLEVFEEVIETALTEAR